MGLEVFFILVLILLNGVFAMSETALVSARKLRLEQLAEEGNERAGVALELANDPNRFLSTVQFGISLIGTFAGVFGGATIAEKLMIKLNEVTWLQPYSESLALGIVVLAITYLSLILGELVPKRLALYYPERIAAGMANSMQRLARLASPFVRLLSFSTEAVLRLFRVKPPAAPTITEEEVKAMIEQGTEAGVFEEAEQNIFDRVFRLGDRRVSTLMTSRSDIIWLDLNDSLEEMRGKISGSGFSRFPLCQGSLDNLLGVVRVKDLVAQTLNAQPPDLRAIMRQPLFVHEKMRILKVLELFRVSRTHIAIAIDEYGEIQGLLTLNDILEAIVGDVPNPGMTAQPQVLQRDDGSWLVDGYLPIDEFKQLFDLTYLPGDDKGDFETLGGFVMVYLERIPAAGEYFDWGGLRFEVLDMDGNRVDKVLVKTLQPIA
ncbi:HlyC/CorC family transporter [candidate division KSB1 bacterium]|nr:HlyC/CorC family transporter [candidate division KSB1 bacterium]